jgi:hypothetical protein
MYTVETLRTAAEIRSNQELNGILRHLSSLGYKPVLRTGATATLAACGITENPYSEECAKIIAQMFSNSSAFGSVAGNIPGEIFFRDENLVAFLPVSKSLYALEARDHLSASSLKEFCGNVEAAAKKAIDGRRLRGMSFEWQVATLSPRRPRRSIQTRGLVRPMSDLTTKPAELSDAAVKESELLVSRESREFFIRLAQLGKARSIDAQADVKTNYVTPLLNIGLVREEFLVQCRKDSHTLCTTETKDEIIGESGGRYRCSVCGRPFSEELIQEIYAPAPGARKMLDGSHWMTIWITSILVQSGIALEQLSWGATAGDDEIDIVAKVQDQTIFFELKDRVFGLGDAYPFTARVQRYGANTGVIITMEDVAEEAQKFLREQSRSLDNRIHTISGESEIRTKIPLILKGIARSAAAEIFNAAFMHSSIDPSSILNAWFARPSAR